MPAEGVAPQPPLFTGGGAACTPAHMRYYMPYTAETVQPPPLDMPNVQSAYPAGFMTPPPSEISLLQQFDALPISMARRVIQDLVLARTGKLINPELLPADFQLWVAATAEYATAAATAAAQSSFIVPPLADIPEEETVVEGFKITARCQMGASFEDAIAAVQVADSWCCADVAPQEVRSEQLLRCATQAERGRRSFHSAEAPIE